MSRKFRWGWLLAGVLALVLLAIAFIPSVEFIVGGAGPSLPDEYNAAVEGLRIGPFVGSCGTASFWNVPVIVEDIAKDPLWADLRDAAGMAGAQERGTAGAFDYYVLALTWTPSWCALTGDREGEPDCDPGTGFGWSLHGLWPQYEAGWPVDCATEARGPSRAPATSSRPKGPRSRRCWRQGRARHQSWPPPMDSSVCST